MAILIDNFLPISLVNELEKVITHHQFPWYWRPSTNYGIEGENESSEDFQFIHLIYYNGTVQSEIFELVRNIVQGFANSTNIAIKNIYKIKANLLTKQTLSSEALHETVHIDIEGSNFLSIIYYVTEADGDTVIFNKNNEVDLQISPKKGSAVYFPSNLNHRATPPTNYKRRIVLNIVVEI
jgi:hypothetical protein